MNKRTGLYPAVQVEAAACGVVSQAGGVALLETARVSGLDRLLSRSLEPWRAPRAVHDPGEGAAGPGRDARFGLGLPG